MDYQRLFAQNILDEKLSKTFFNFVLLFVPLGKKVFTIPLAIIRAK